MVNREFRITGDFNIKEILNQLRAENIVSILGSNKSLYLPSNQIQAIELVELATSTAAYNDTDSNNN